MRKKFWLHQAAKNALDEMGARSFLRSKSCRRSTRNCWKKKKTYAEYWRSREECGALTAKANVDRVLKNGGRNRC